MYIEIGFVLEEFSTVVAFVDCLENQKDGKIMNNVFKDHPGTFLQI
jgi:hypothetical protein